MPHNLELLRSVEDTVTAALRAEREIFLQVILGKNYQRAVDAGLVDLFHFDPKTGEDGLRHTLTGSIKKTRGGTRVPSGFHHEESARRWTEYVQGEGGQSEPSYVRNPESRQVPLGRPYKDEVVVFGVTKYGFRKCPDTGERKILPAQNTMFPYHNSALGVLQLVGIAHANRDQAAEELQIMPAEPRFNRAEGARIAAVGEAPLFDGTTVKIRMVRDFNSDRIITAMPLMPQSGGQS